MSGGIITPLSQSNYGSSTEDDTNKVVLVRASTRLVKFRTMAR